MTLPNFGNRKSDEQRFGTMLKALRCRFTYSDDLETFIRISQVKGVEKETFRIELCPPYEIARIAKCQNSKEAYLELGDASSLQTVVRDTPFPPNLGNRYTSFLVDADGKLVQ